MRKLVFLLIFVFVSGCVQSDIESVRLKVVGESITGLLYTKEMNLTREWGTYILSYSCTPKKGFENLCKNNFTGKVDERAAKLFLKTIQNLKDEGERAKCCDHAWTEIKLIYSNKTQKRIIIGKPIEVEKIFNLQ